MIRMVYQQQQPFIRMNHQQKTQLIKQLLFVIRLVYQLVQLRRKQLRHQPIAIILIQHHRIR